MSVLSSLFWLAIGLAPPTACGWLLLEALEHRTPVLWKTERLAMGFVLGLTCSMFAAFLLHAVGHMPLSLPGFLATYAVLLVPLAALRTIRRRKPLTPMIAEAAPSPAMPSWLKVLLGVLLGWTVLKIAAMGLLLFATPTYFDDAADNWNYRGKIFYAQHAIVLTLPPDTAPNGISSYPPTVPLAKAWLASLEGAWDEGTVNGLHVAWFAAVLLLVYCTLRRSLSRFWSWLGVYLAVSLPLLLVHGTTAYADLFLASHLLVAVVLLSHAYGARTAASCLAFLRLAALAAAVIPFTKNEGLLLYLPPLGLLALWTLWQARRTGLLTPRQTGIAAAWFAGLLLLVAVPWIAYKELHGLTFGNAKPLSGFELLWEPAAVPAIVINTFFEGNWLLFFPLLLCLLALRPKRALRGPLMLLAVFFLLSYGGQLALYLFTGLAAEAVRQTGYARGIIQIIPVGVILVMMLLHAALQRDP